MSPRLFGLEGIVSNKDSWGKLLRPPILAHLAATIPHSFRPKGDC